MTFFEGLCILITFCMIYGMICFGLGVMYGSRNSERKCDIDNNSGVCTTCGNRDRCKYNGHNKQKGAEK